MNFKTVDELRRSVPDELEKGVGEEKLNSHATCTEKNREFYTKMTQRLDKLSTQLTFEKVHGVQARQ